MGKCEFEHLTAYQPVGMLFAPPENIKLDRIGLQDINTLSYLLKA